MGTGIVSAFVTVDAVTFSAISVYLVTAHPLYFDAIAFDVAVEEKEAGASRLAQETKEST